MTVEEPEISIIVPVFRNAATLRPLHSRLVRTLGSQPTPIEILFVDDASPDESAAVLKQLAREDPKVAVLTLARNHGQNRALLIGLHSARGERSVIMDADLQDPPEAIPSLLAGLDEGFEAVFGGRRGDYQSRSRMISSRAFKWLRHLVSGAPRDAGSFVALGSPMRARLLAMSRPFGSVVSMIGCAQLPIASVPIERSTRQSGESAYRWHGRLAAGLRDVLWVVYWKALGRGRQDAARITQQNSSEAYAAIRSRIGQRYEAASENE